jgi:hypothetical protein
MPPAISTFVLPDARPSPAVVSGAIDIFHAYVEQLRASLLAPDGLVIIDNLGSHKIAQRRLAISAAPKSRDLKLIEQDCGNSQNPVGRHQTLTAFKPRCSLATRQHSEAGVQ